ncbi:isochorismatase family protein [Streptomyces sp. NPDC056660]|uniref:isochorismatase family protein n=1 Tax=Streptomyces sp. NPDC056660 TaxID=3345897 RepID=UPI00367FAFC8
MPRPPLKLEPAHTALVISECQNGVVGPSTTLPELAAAAAPVLPVIARVAEAARKAGVHVVHLTYAPVLGNRSSNLNTPLMAKTSQETGSWAKERSAGQVVDEIGTEPGDLVLQRHTGMSPTHNTELFALLRNIGVTSVLLAGVSLNVAIPVATTELADEGFRVAIARDTVAGTPAEHAESMLRHTLRHLATITTANEVIAAWS